VVKLNEGSSLMSKNMNELQEEFDLKQSAPRRLRGICNGYRNDKSSSGGSKDESSL